MGVYAKGIWAKSDLWISHGEGIADKLGGMGRYHVADDYEDDPEEPDESDMDEDQADEFAETVECPECGRDIYDGVEQCPHCRSFLLKDDPRVSRKPRWIIWTAVGLVALIIYFWFRRGSWF